MTEFSLTDDMRIRARKRLLSELLLESEWLMQRREPPQVRAIPNFPTASAFFGGGIPLTLQETNDNEDSEKDLGIELMIGRKDDSKQHGLYTIAGPACMMSVLKALSSVQSPTNLTGAGYTNAVRAEVSVPAGDIDGASKSRMKINWASLCEPQRTFADDVDLKHHNPSQGVIVEGENISLEWVHDPWAKFNATSTILAGTRNSPTKTTILKILGDPAPLSPVVQPFPFFTRRNKRRACPFHSSLESNKPSVHTLAPEIRAYRSAWDREEPLTVPPICSCNNEALVSKYQNLIKRILECISLERSSGKSLVASSIGGSSATTQVTKIRDVPSAELVVRGAMSRSPPVTASAAGNAEISCQEHSPKPSLNDNSFSMLHGTLKEANDFLSQQCDCSICGGLQYFPFSFIEIPLTHEISSLSELCEKVPIPPDTEIFCDGPKVTACIICKTPEHEWNIYKALVVVNEHERAAIYDVCTSHYFPGYQATKLYWSRTLMTTKCSPQVTVESAVSPLQETNSPCSINSPQGSNQMDLATEQALSINEDVEPETPIHRKWRSLMPNFDSPLNPPQQSPLNLARCEPHSLYVTIAVPGLTTVELRRIYCISLRSLPAGFKASQHVDIATCISIENTHRERVAYAEAVKRQAEIVSLRRRNFLADHRLAALRQQALTYRLTSPNGISISPRVSRPQHVVPIRPSSQPQSRVPLRGSASIPGPTGAVLDDSDKVSVTAGSSLIPKDARRSPGTPSRATGDHPLSSVSSRNTKATRLTASTGVGSDTKKPQIDSMPRYPPNAYASAAASRIHALRSAGGAQSHNSDRR